MFMDLMNIVLQLYLDEFIIVFIDYILIYFENEQKNEEHHHVVLQLLTQHPLYGRLSQCEFLMGSMMFLGYVIAKG